MPTYGIAASGEDYTTIGGAISDTKSGGGNAWNADTDGILTLEIRDNRDYNENQLTMSGWPGTDDAAGHVVFDCAAANRGLGKNDSGKFRLISSTAGHLCLINANFLIIRNWTMDQNSTGSSDECIRFVGNLDRVLIEKSYLECNNTSSQDCIHATATTQTSLYIFDCVVVAGGSSARCTINPQNYTGSNTQTWHVEHVTSYSPVNTSNMGGIGADQVGGSATVNFNVYNCLSFGTGATGEDFPDASSGMNPVGAGNIAADASVDIYGTTDNKDSLTISATDEAATDVLITTEWTDFQVKEGSDQKAASNYFASGSTRDGREDTSKDIAGNDRPGATHSNRTIGAFQVVSGGVTLVVADALQAITADSPTLTQAHVLNVADTLQTVAAAGVTLTQASTLIVSDALHAMLADNVALVSGGQIGEVIFVVEAVNRTFVVAPRHRIFNVEAVDRIFTLDRYKTRH